MIEINCANCGKSLDQNEIPQHCGKPMILNKKANQIECWMGSSCGFLKLNDVLCAKCSEK